jgi:hypothetical protein
MSVLICAACVFGGATAARNGTAFAAADAEKIPYKRLGAFLPGEATAANGSFVTHPISIYDNSGMNGNDGITHKHGNDSAKMWRSRSDAQISALSPVIELDSPNQLGLMFIWNYNAAGQTDAGIKNATVSYSADNQNWTDLGAFVFARASGEAGIKATNLQNGGLPVDFGGAYARYVRITPAATDGNWGGGGYGLSEVKIYEFKVEAKPGAYIKAVPFGASATAFFRAVDGQSALTNGSGLDSPKASRALHDNDPAHMWDGTGNSLMFYLYGRYPLSDMYIWNYNAPGSLNYGAKDVTVEYSSDPTGAWVKLGDYTVAMSSGGAGEGASAKITFGNKKAQIVRITVKNNYGGARNGLAAVRFYCGTGDYYEPAHEWSSVASTYDGLFGADGIFTAAMGGDDYAKTLDQRAADEKTWFVFSDTDVLPSGKTVDEVNRTATGFEMPNNTFAVFTGNDAFDGEMTRYFKRGSSGSQYTVAPVDTSNGARWWLGDTIVQGGKVYLTPHRVENYSGGMGFQQTGGTLISFGIDADTGITDFGGGYTSYDDDKNPYMTYFQGTTDILMNAGIFANTAEAGAPDPDGYIYNYGNFNQNGRFLAVARVPAAQFEDLSAYRYYNGGSWVTGIQNSEKGPANVSPELSVTPVAFGENAGKYMLLYQHNTQSAQTAVRFADNPWGPWGEAQVIHYTVEPFYMRQIYDANYPGLDGNPYCYNAKAHPALSKAGEMIFSYNMNYMGGDNGGMHAGHLKNIDNYNPRFLRHSATGTAAVSDNGGFGTEGIKADSVTLDASALTLTVGGAETLTATVRPDGAYNKELTWTSSDTAVAVVNAGTVTAVAAGTAVIAATARDGSGARAECAVTVVDGVQIASITLDKTAVSIKAGGTETLAATVDPGNATVQDLRWRTSDPLIATVDADGKITAKKVGEAVIRAEARDGSGVAAECVVFVTEAAGGGCGKGAGAIGLGAVTVLAALYSVMGKRR